MPCPGHILCKAALTALLLFLCIPPASAEDSACVVLRINGMVKTPLKLTLSDLTKLPSITREKIDPEKHSSALEGISVWRLVTMAGPKKEADSIIFFAPDGNTGGMPLPLEYLDQSDAMLVLKKDKRPLPSDQGLPFLPPSQVQLGYKWTDHSVSRILITDISGLTGSKNPAW